MSHQSAPNDTLTGLEIAIIGMAGRFPGADDIAQYWELLAAGREGLRQMSDDELHEAGIDALTSARSDYVRKRGVIGRKREFDAALFGYSPAEAAVMDPQFAVFHEVAWTALENAGYTSSKFDGLIGVYAGASPNLSWMQRVVAQQGAQAGAADYYTLSSLTDAGYLSTRLAHRLDLTGPAITSNTTCSTSLVGIHLACQALLTGECDIALGGGVSVSVDNKGYVHQPDMVLSPDGACRPFAAGAAGTAAGEGCGVLVLKRLADALADNDTILAVVKGSAINNDGQRKVGFSAPGGEGQARVIQAALDRAEVDASTITYLEAHGTATKLGDPIEFGALREVFAHAAPGSCLLGSVKSNIGHLGEASGVAGAMKVVLSLQHGQIPPSLHFDHPNPLLDMSRSAFRVATALEDWTPPAWLPRRAGVSSFGIGGTNAHAVFEQAPPLAPSGAGRANELVFLSANTPGALDKMRAALASYAEREPQARLADLAYTLHVGRKDLPWRAAFVAADLTDLVQHAQGAPSAASVVHGHVDKGAARLVFMFPGQGTQYYDMARQLYRSEPRLRAFMDECFDIARRRCGVDLAPTLFPATAPASGLLDTALAQPLLFIVEHSLARLLEQWGCHADALVGHSVGEYVAACLAGVFSLEDAIELVVERGRLVQALPGGKMLAAAASEAQVRAAVGDAVCIAAVNGERRTVLSGDAAEIEAARVALAEAAIDSVALHTSHAFHSRHMEPALDAFRRVVARVTLAPPTRPLLSNLSGTWIGAAEATSPDYWVAHLRGTVRFGDCLATLCAEAPQMLLEVGPGGALAAFAQQQPRGVHVHRIASLLPGARQSSEAQDRRQFAEALCHLFAAGVDFDWGAYYDGQSRRRVTLPTYPFEGRNHYAALLQATPLARVAATPAATATAGVGEAAAEPAPQLALEAVADGLTPTQARVAAVWKKFLGVDAVDIDADVFTLGVDSLMSIRVITEFRETFQIDLSLDTIFMLRTPSQQAAEIDRRTGKAEPMEIALPPLTPRDHGGVAPLSTSQRRLWIVSQFERDKTAYNNGFWHFFKSLDVGALEQAFRAIVRRHAILRTQYREVKGEPQQVVREDFEFHIVQRDISDAAPAAERFRVGSQLWKEALNDPIDLATDLMLRVHVVKYDAETHLLMVTQHHICSDNWSNNVLMDETRVLYDAFSRGEPDPLPPLPVQYIDYALWQREWLASGVLAQQLPYWKRTLAGMPTVHNLPLDRPRLKYQSYSGTQYSSRIGADVLEGLNELGQRAGTTLFMTMQAAFALFLGRYSGEDDVVTGFMVANRLHKELEPLIGFFVNTLVLRSNLAGNPSFLDFLARTKSRLLEAYANAHVPFESLVEELNPPRSTSYEPVVQIKLIFLDQSQAQGGRGNAHEIVSDAKIVGQADMNVPFSKYDLTLFFGVVDNQISLAWEYATDLFDASTIHRMAENFETLLRSIIANPVGLVRNLPLERTGAPRALDPSGARDEDFQFSLFYFASDDGGNAYGKYRLLTEGARFADRSGFEAVWTPERHFDAFGGVYPNPAITAAAVAAITQHVKVRAGSCVLPIHNPVRVAEDWSVIDNLSHGRVGIGFAAGYSARDFTLAPHNFQDRRDVLVRDVQTVKALWRGESVMLPNGNGELNEIRIRPRPIQPELPVWVTTIGNEEAFRHAGRIGDNILTHLMGQSLEELAKKIKIYRAERVAAGHPSAGVITLLVHTFVTDDEAMVFTHAKEPFKKYLVDSVGTPQAIARTLGLGDPGVAGGNADIEAITEFAFNRYYQSNALLGTAKRCLPLAQAIRDAGVNEIACLIDFGVQAEVVLENLRHLRDLRDLVAPDARPAGPYLDEVEPTATLPAMSYDACIHRRFEARAAIDVDRPAVVYEGETISYAELDARANRVANLLIERYGPQLHRRIGLCTSRSVHMIVGMLAIMKAGAAYVPIEPQNPASHATYLIESAGIELVLTLRADAPVLRGLPVAVVEIDGAEPATFAPTPPGVAVGPRDLAYVTYKSGSTGKPKGVMIEHRAAVNCLDVLASTTHAGLQPNARVSLNSSFTFDMSLRAILQLLSGHCVVVVPQAIRLDPARMLAFLREHRIDVHESTPTQFYGLLAEGLIDDAPTAPGAELPHQVQVVVLGGEAINATAWQRMRESRTTRFYNMYGPTECTIYMTSHLINGGDPQPTIGRPIANTQVHLLDEYGQPVPQGAVGEIVVSGVCVARGYLNRPELTAQRFVPDPSSNDPAARRYRTGDLGRWTGSGNIAYLGRTDLQVKLRGFRVELGEIENVMLSDSRVREAAAIALGEDEARYLMAYVVPARAGMDENALVADLKRDLAAKMPAYMVPHGIVMLAVFPLNESGKLDRTALAELSVALRPQEDVEPGTPTEIALEAIWSEVLDGGPIGIHENFFEIGGQSIAAIRIVNEIVDQLGVELQTRTLFEYSTIEALAGYIDSLVWARANGGGKDDRFADDDIELEL